MNLSLQIILGQLSLGLVNGAFYALLSVGLALIFGLLRVINFAHGALYMLGAFVALVVLERWNVSYWNALWLAPLAVGSLGLVVERFLLRRIYEADHLFSLMLTFGLALIIQGLMQNEFGSASVPYPTPELLQGVVDLGFIRMPTYRLWVLVVSLVLTLSVWLAIERTSIGAHLRAANENPVVLQSFGVNVPRLLALTYSSGVALAAFAGVMAAPIYQVNPLMGTEILIVAFAVVVIGGMGSIIGAILAGYLLGLVEGATRLLYPEATNVVIFVIMALVIWKFPNGLMAERS